MILKGYNYQVQKTGNFIIWESDSLGYTPQGGTDTSNAASTLTYNLGHRLFLDPYLKIIDKFNNRHSFKNRIYYVKNGITDWIKNWKNNGWKTAKKQPVKNKELWVTLDNLVSEHDITWKWIKGHSGHPENERADELANEAIISKG